ncbi:MAG: long-chain fatty acid--CoA ligase [Bacteroidetes bacterium]|nr:long-chain fatty acid--CoA ligase [Bacteroidota bacterium]MBU1680498.1 long-chain fatty acid--CoA ligase [Bacteroidota bacterium]MBU2505399.1 long-chain fatty acid--CoA ligase [Bacteroidota bacterium]
MPTLSHFKTIPDLYSYLVNDFGKSQTKPVFKVKVGEKYTDISYQQMKEEVESFANGLAYMGVKRDSKVSIIAENRPEWVYSDMAILGLGGVDVPLYPISTSETIEFIINDSESVGIIVSNNFQLNKVMKIRNNCKDLKFIVVMGDMDVSEYSDVYTFKTVQEKGNQFSRENPNHLNESLKIAAPDDLCTIIYTSGTTGIPKGVMLTHNNIMSNVRAVHDIFSIDYNDTFLSFLPLCHIFERMGGYYTALSAGCTVAYAESIEKVGQNLTEIKPTVMTAVPRLFERMYSKIHKNVDAQPEKKQKIFHWAVATGAAYAEARKAPGSIPIGLSLKHKLADKLVLSKIRDKTGGNLKFIISGGAALPRAMGDFFESVGLLIIEGYGLTESSPVISINRVNDYKFGSVGKPVPGVEVKIAKDGEILAAGPNIMQGYYKNKKETEETIKDGWLYTGDIGVFDAEGFLIITDRKKNLFKTSGGKYIAPTPLENLFLASKYIDQFILIGDRRMFLSALIVPDFEALKEFADANRIPYKDPLELTKLKQVYELLEKDLAQFQKKLANYERVRKFTILDKAFTIEGGEMTPSLKIKRKVIEERYSDLIDDMYKGLEA